MVKITSIEILINAMGIDRVFLHTDLPPTFPEIVDMQNMQMVIDLQHGTAIEYLRKYFRYDKDMPATATLIDGSNGKKTVIDIGII